jgi:hypothetical protein
MQSVRECTCRLLFACVACMSKSVSSDAHRAGPAGGLYEGKFLDEAIRRYEGLWLPLIARNGGKISCVPPYRRGLHLARAPHGVVEVHVNHTAFCQQAFGHALVPAHPFRFSTTKAGTLDGPWGWKENESFYPPK